MKKAAFFFSALLLAGAIAHAKTVTMSDVVENNLTSINEDNDWAGKDRAGRYCQVGHDNTSTSGDVTSVEIDTWKRKSDKTHVTTLVERDSRTPFSYTSKNGKNIFVETSGDKAVVVIQYLGKEKAEVMIQLTPESDPVYCTVDAPDNI